MGVLPTMLFLALFFALQEFKLFFHGEFAEALTLLVTSGHARPAMLRFTHGFSTKSATFLARVSLGWFLGCFCHGLEYQDVADVSKGRHQEQTLPSHIAPGFIHLQA
jgi:hypothetical protein